MSITEKRSFVQKAIEQADDALIEALYQELLTDSVLKQKLTSRATRAEDDMKHGRLMDIHALKKRWYRLVYFVLDGDARIG